MPAWRVLQLADSAFPIGGFAHSAGLEAAMHAGHIRTAADLEAFVADAITATAHGALPLVRASHADPARLAELDARSTAMLWSHVADRASRAQGRALVDAAVRAFAVLADVRGAIQRGELAGHLAPIFGVVARALDVTEDDTLATFLHLTLRGLLSAAVRLGLAGPFEAQALHARLDGTLDAALALARTLAVDDAAQTSPLAELVQAGHDRLYTRLFQT